MKILKLLVVTATLAISIASVSGITYVLCRLLGTQFSFAAALVIWIIWFAMNIIRGRILNEDNS